MQALLALELQAIVLVVHFVVVETMVNSKQTFKPFVHAPSCWSSEVAAHSAPETFVPDLQEIAEVIARTQRATKSFIGRKERVEEDRR